MADTSAGGKEQQPGTAHPDDTPTVRIPRRPATPGPVWSQWPPSTGTETPTVKLSRDAAHTTEAHTTETHTSEGTSGRSDVAALPTQRLDAPASGPLDTPTMPTSAPTSAPIAEATPFVLMDRTPRSSGAPSMRDSLLSAIPRLAPTDTSKHRPLRARIISSAVAVAVIALMFTWLGAGPGSPLRFLHAGARNVPAQTPRSVEMPPPPPPPTVTPITTASPSGTGTVDEYPMASLSPALATYLNSEGQHVGVSIFDVTRNRLYQYNADDQFTVGSEIKIALMLEYFASIEAQGQSPSANDQTLLTEMIEYSNNDAAQDYYSEFNYDQGLSQFLQHVGAQHFTASKDGFGWFTLAPSDMVHILAMFSDGKLANASDRAFGLSLMENIESDERQGLGTSAPSGATIAMKDGWVVAPDGLWAANSSGIVTVHGETYIISVNTQDFDTLDDAYSVLNTVCKLSANGLVS